MHAIAPWTGRSCPEIEFLEKESMVRRYVSDTAELTEEYGIHIGRWSQYRDLGRLPFDAMWCVIPPGGSSSEDIHPEVEFAVVTRGRAVYESDGTKVEVPTGGVIHDSQPVRGGAAHHSQHLLAADRFRGRAGRCVRPFSF
jgi:hypothetical protein